MQKNDERKRVNMKKTLTVLGIILLALTVLTTVANAATTEELVSFLSQAHEIAGETKQITAAQKVEVERFLSEYPVTEEQADQVIAKIKEGIAIMDAAGTADLDKLSSSEKSSLTALANEVGDILDVKLVVDSSTKSVAIYDKDGKQLSSVPYGNTDTLVNTGANYTVYIVASVLAIFAVATIIIANKKRTVNA